MTREQNELYNLAKLVITHRKVTMALKAISSTQAQNNFGRVLDDVVQNQARYIIKRRNAPQAILVSLSELEHLLSASAGERRRLEEIIREQSSAYHLGTPLD
ncbi:MAG: type II toxin-antitoxin system Phd/YefM family antitoxin [Caldilineaceae bacterium SB0661_bin_32]|uniref:Antitoxin n=1 Tax=Caldilineaceae bacterium SB0661_bin_32 TaxID=2605255 RepID=A0A6B1DDT2_9CHLR|nr:type II toxin-antitoxin system Phd/YefM family antitoxin [Caldilineaceae bacterium SB0661_bin_32]